MSFRVGIGSLGWGFVFQVGLFSPLWTMGSLIWTLVLTLIVWRIIWPIVRSGVNTLQCSGFEARSIFFRPWILWTTLQSHWCWERRLFDCNRCTACLSPFHKLQSDGVNQKFQIIFSKQFYLHSIGSNLTGKISKF